MLRGSTPGREHLMQLALRHEGRDPGHLAQADAAEPWPYGSTACLVAANPSGKINRLVAARDPRSEMPGSTPIAGSGRCRRGNPSSPNRMSSRMASKDRIRKSETAYPNPVLWPTPTFGRPTALHSPRDDQRGGAGPGRPARLPTQSSSTVNISASSRI